MSSSSPLPPSSHPGKPPEFAQFPNPLKTADPPLVAASPTSHPPQTPHTPPQPTAPPLQSLMLTCWVRGMRSLVGLARRRKNLYRSNLSRAFKKFKNASWPKSVLRSGCRKKAGLPPRWIALYFRRRWKLKNNAPCLFLPSLPIFFKSRDRYISIPLRDCFSPAFFRGSPENLYRYRCDGHWWGVIVASFN